MYHGSLCHWNHFQYIFVSYVIFHSLKINIKLWIHMNEKKLIRSVSEFNFFLKSPRFLFKSHSFVFTFSKCFQLISFLLPSRFFLPFSAIFDRSVWNTVRYRILDECCFSSFLQNNMTSRSRIHYPLELCTFIKMP